MDRAPRLGLLALYAFTVVALLGFATFGLNPGLLARYPQGAGFFAMSFGFFAQVHIWLAFAVLAVVLALHAGVRWLGAFAAVYVMSLGSELLGTSAGIPFGEYRYTEALGWKWLDHVPLVIPLSWFSMALPSYVLARAALATSAAGRMLAGSLVLLAWDLALDPAMSYATAYWVWAEPGAYYGMPWSNLFGWYVTGLALMGVLEALRVERWLEGTSPRWMAAFYAGNLLMPLGMSVAAGMWGAVAATGLVLGGLWVVGWRVAERTQLAASTPEVAV